MICCCFMRTARLIGLSAQADLNICCVQKCDVVAFAVSRLVFSLTIQVNSPSKTCFWGSISCLIILIFCIFAVIYFCENVVFAKVTEEHNEIRK